MMAKTNVIVFVAAFGLFSSLLTVHQPAHAVCARSDDTSRATDRQYKSELCVAMNEGLEVQNPCPDFRIFTAVPDVGSVPGGSSANRTCQEALPRDIPDPPCEVSGPCDADQLAWRWAGAVTQRAAAIPPQICNWTLRTGSGRCPQNEERTITE